MLLIRHSLRLDRGWRLATHAGLGILLALSITVSALAQAAGGRILLVLPFENRSGQPRLDWVREAAPELLSSRFLSAGFAPMSRAERLYALDHLGLPPGFQPSRASSLKLAETLDANSIVVGSYRTEGTEILAEARLVDVPHLQMSTAVTARGGLTGLIAVFDSLAWKLTRKLDPKSSVAEESFLAAGKGLRVDAFEQYVRGISDPDQSERMRHLNKAVALSPQLAPAWMALGREDYAGQQYDLAAEAFAKVSVGDLATHGPDALEAGFYSGLALLFSGEYPKAEAAFANVARVLPLAEVVNNEGVALARQGKNGKALFQQAVTADPNQADYHFNLAVSERRSGDTAGAQKELAECLKLRPNDSEAQWLATAWKSADATADPLERILRSFDAVAFRQAAQMLNQMEDAHLAQLTPGERARKLAAQAREYLDRGLLLEAERISLDAVAADDKAAEAHASLAGVRERTGDSVAARKEATTSLELKPSAVAYLVLGRLDWAAGNLDEASKEADEAVQIEPASKAAAELKQNIEAKKAEKK